MKTVNRNTHILKNGGSVVATSGFAYTGGTTQSVNSMIIPPSRPFYPDYTRPRPIMPNMTYVNYY